MSTEQRLRAAAKANRKARCAEELDGCEELMEEAADEIKELLAKVVEIQTQADEDVIDARDAAWNLFTKRVNRRRAKKIWPWLAEYEEAEKARGT